MKRDFERLAREFTLKIDRHYTDTRNERTHHTARRSFRNTPFYTACCFALRLPLNCTRKTVEFRRRGSVVASWTKAGVRHGSYNPTVWSTCRIGSWICSAPAGIFNPLRMHEPGFHSTVADQHCDQDYWRYQGDCNPMDDSPVVVRGFAHAVILQVSPGHWHSG